MTTLPIIMYEEVIRQDFLDALLVLNKADFDPSDYIEGKIAITYSLCRFTNLKIENVEEIDFPDVSISFHNCVITDMDIEEVTSKNISINFIGSTLKGRIVSENFSSLEFSDCLVPGGLFLTGLNKISVNFSKRFGEDNYWREFFKEHGMEKSMPHNFKTPNNYYFINCKNIRFESHGYLPVADSFPKISLDLRYEKDSKDTETVVSGLHLQSFSLSGTPVGKIYIENLNINRWYVYNLHPKGDLSFYNIGTIKGGKEDKKIGFHRCMLDNVVFDNIAFNDYPIVSFYQSKFSKARFTSCDFPDSYDKFGFVELANVHYPDKIPKNQDKAIYEIFLQLKKSFEDSGNFHEAQKIHAISHEALKRVKGISWWDRKILWINSWSNNHGLSIKRPFWWFLGTSITLYLFYLLSIGRLFKCTGFDSTLIGYYFSFIDITHRTDFLVKQSDFTAWSLFLDYITKIVVGFFIFQFIAAFRKYGKK